MQTDHLDQAGTTTSVLCAIHCALSPLVLPLLPLTATRLVGPTLEWGFVATSLVLGVASLTHGYRVVHRDWRAMALFGTGFAMLMFVRLSGSSGIIEPLGVFGAATMIIASHVLNLRLRRTNLQGDCACPCHDETAPS